MEAYFSLTRQCHGHEPAVRPGLLWPRLLLSSCSAKGDLVPNVSTGYNWLLEREAGKRPLFPGRQCPTRCPYPSTLYDLPERGKQVRAGCKESKDWQTLFREVKCPVSTKGLFKKKLEEHGELGTSSQASLWSYLTSKTFPHQPSPAKPRGLFSCRTPPRS